MAARDKIIRVEDINRDDIQDDSSQSLMMVQSDIGLHGEHDKLSGSELVLREESLVETATEVLAIEDTAGKNLPEGWPNIAKTNEPHSWDFSTAVSPSINKAVGHLELLQVVIEEWLKIAESKLATSSKTSSKTKVSPKRSSHSTTKSGSRKRLHFNDGDGDAGSQQLSVHGIGAKRDDADSSVHVTVREDTNTTSTSSEGFPYLGAEEVVEDTLALLAKLETDRRETLAKLARERERVKMLGEKIDNLAERRLIDLPIAIQTEHEACAQTISELNWNVTYKSRNEERLMTRVSVAAALNKKLKEDVDFIHSHIPLVKEKLELELLAMNKIETAQEETYDELRITEDHFAAVTEKSLELHEMADKERKAMRNDLDGVRLDLKNISAELEEAKKLNIAHTQASQYCAQKLIDDKEELKVLVVKEENAKTKEAMETEKRKDMKDKIGIAEYEHGKLAGHLEKVLKKKQEKVERNEKFRTTTEKKINQKTEANRKMNRRNKEFAMNIEDMELKIKECDKQKVRDDKNLVRMVRELDRTEKLIEVTEDDLAMAANANAILLEQLRSEEDRCCALEEQLRQTTEQLLRQLKDEQHNRTTLLARINSDSEESEKFEVEVRDKMSKVSKKWDEVQVAVAKIMAKVEKYRLEVEKRQLTITDWEEKIADLRQNRVVMEAKTIAELAGITPVHEELKFAVSSIEKQLTHISNKTDYMETKMEDMTAQSAMMEKNFKNTNRQIDNLDELRAELGVQMDINKKLDDATASSLDDVTSRTNNRARVHRELMKERKVVHEDQVDELKMLLKQNDQLAKRYRILQNDYLILKNTLLNTYDDNVRSENAIKDVRQLQSLQKRMQAAMLEYYKYRGLYNQSELQRLEHESNHNGFRVGVVKDDMDGCLDKIAHFLVHTFNADSIHQAAMEKASKEEKLIQQSFNAGLAV